MHWLPTCVESPLESGPLTASPSCCMILSEGLSEPLIADGGGTVNMIAKKTVGEMIRLFGSSPSDVRAVIGPGIGFDSFQVGEEVALVFKESGFPVDRIWNFRGARAEDSMEGGHHIDLKECVRISLLDCGVPEENIQVSDVDTYIDDRFYSARREGTQTGRNINAVKMV